MKYYYTRLKKDHNSNICSSIILRDQETEEEQEVEMVYNSYEAHKRVLQLQKELKKG